MTLAQLTYFVKTAQRGHLTEAAGELMIAQPSLSQALQKLEEDLGFPLFEKRGRKIVLTREGEEFYSYALKVVEAQEKARQAALQIEEGGRGLVRFIHTEPMPVSFVSDLISDFLDMEENRDVRIECDVAGTARIFRELREDQIDFGFCSEITQDAEDLELYPLFRTPLILITAKDDPLAEKEHVEPQDLIGRPCISYGVRSSMDHQISAFWQEQGITPLIRCRSSAIAIEGLVARGLGWALVGKTDRSPGDNIVVLDMPCLSLERTTYLARRKGRKHGPAAGRFLKYTLARAKTE